MNSKWTAKKDTEVVKILINDASKNNDGRYYYILGKFDLIHVAGVR